MMNIGNMNFGVNKMEIINHLISMNNTLQNQIEQNNLLIQKLKVMVYMYGLVEQLMLAISKMI